MSHDTTCTVVEAHSDDDCNGEQATVRILRSEYRRLRRLATIADEFTLIVLCPQCRLPKPDGFICICGYGE